MSWLASALWSRKDCVAIFVLLTLSNILMLLTSSPLRLLGSVALFCFLPGFLLLNLVFPEWGAFSLLERLLLGAGASYVFSTFCVLAAHFMPGEITLSSIRIALDGFILALLALNILLRKAPAGRLNNGRPDKTELLQIVLLVVLTAFFRFAYLGYSEYQGDEVMVASIARSAIIGQDDALFLQRKGPAEASITIAFALFAGGFDEFVTRFPFALASFLGVMTAYLIGREFFDSFVGFTAGLLLAIEGIFLGFSRLVQYQSVVVFMLTLSVYCFYRFYQADDKWSNRWLFLGAVFVAFGLLTHWGMALILPVIALLYLSRCDVRSLKENALTLFGLLSVVVITLATFYVPFVLHPHFKETQLYLMQDRMGTGHGPYNNLYWYASYAIFYNSIYYVALMGGLLLVVVVGELQRALQPKWLVYLVSASFIAGLVVPAFLSSSLSVGSANCSFAFFLPWLFVLLFSRGIATETKAILFWFFTYFLIYSFAIREPGLHYYALSPAWAIIAGVGLKRMYDFDLRRFIVGLWNKMRCDFGAICRRGMLSVFALLYVLCAFYTYLIFIRHEPIYIVGFPEHKHPLYWTPQVSYPRSGFFGFPHKSGWKTIGYLYRTGVLRGDYMSNEKLQVPRWYLGERLPDEGMPRYFFFDDEYAARVREDAKKYSKEAIGEYYDLVGKVWVHGEAKMLIYEDQRFSSRAAPIDYLSEEYESGYDELASLRELYIYERYRVDDHSFRNLAWYLDVLAPENTGLILSAPEQVGILSYYHKGDIPYYPLPKEQIIDEERTEAELARILAQHNQVYVVFWAAEERDPDGFIEKWLDEHAQQVTERWFGNVRLTLYAVPGKAEEGIRYLEGINLEGKFELVGYELGETSVQPGETIHLTLYWRALAGMEEDYTVFTHLIDEENHIWAQHDKQPLDGAHPTSEWKEGEVVVDEYELILADDVASGEYQIEVGMYEWASGERLAVSENGQWLPENRVTLETVHLRGRS